ncbi:MAG: hypothetical protein EPN85_06820 [Bacteroidetes bacterium]|nr:MAG: hypothetical protein EPN85_06820 [Bacteroidota bacterium]
MIYLTLVFEDELSEFAMSKLISRFGNKYKIHQTYQGYGFGYIKANIKGFNEASIVNPFFVLTDLDRYNCPLELIEEWLNFPKNPNLIFRIAVKEVEAWLLADRGGFAAYTGVSIVNIPMKPELEIDPKRTLLNIVRGCGKRKIKEDILPKNNYAQIGPNYNGRLMEYVQHYWDLNRAIKNSESLQRAVSCLENFQQYLTH